MIKPLNYTACCVFCAFFSVPEHYSVASSFATKSIILIISFNKQKANLGSSSMKGLFFRNDQLLHSITVHMKVRHGNEEMSLPD